MVLYDQVFLEKLDPRRHFAGGGGSMPYRNE
jgi:hypothetical protein